MRCIGIDKHILLFLLNVFFEDRINPIDPNPAVAAHVVF